MTAALLAAPSALRSQADTAGAFEPPRPAYPQGHGPRVCIDQAHNNFHTAAGAYAPFAELLVSDGYRVDSVTARLDAADLADCDILVLATPVAADDREPGGRPHRTAFTSGELPVLVRWIRAGGSLMLVVDYAPVPAATSELAAVLGVAMLNAVARNDPSLPVPDIFRTTDGTLRRHPILEGRGFEERVDSVATWTGAAFRASREYRALMVYGPRSRAWIDLKETVPGLLSREWPVFLIDGWLAGATREWGSGRIVVLGEAAMCAAAAGELGEPDIEPPAQNTQFCLNAIHWLSDLID